MKNLYLFSFLFILFISCKGNVSEDKAIVKNKELIEEKVLVNEAIQKAEPISTPIIQDLPLNKNFILGKFSYKKDTSFTKVASIHSTKSLYLNKEVYKAFKKMHTDAAKENINLKIISGTRNFYEQKGIWERKWEKYKALPAIDRAKKILEFSSMPTTSRHHWGTDMDLNNLNNSYFEKGQGKKEYEWLIKNGNNYGFYQVYTYKNTGRTGYNLEKWHWSYLPLANAYLNYYNENIKYKDISGFKGAELASQLTIIKSYVNGISEKAKLFTDK